MGSASCSETHVEVMEPQDPTETKVADEDLVLLVRDEGYGGSEPIFWEYRIAKDGSFSVVGHEPQRGFFARAGGHAVLEVQDLLSELTGLSFFDLSMDRIHEDMKSAPTSKPENWFVHAGSYRVRARHEGREADVDLILVDEHAAFYPTLPELQNAAECKRRIEAFLDRCCRR
jgi:hypothetical protein